MDIKVASWTGPGHHALGMRRSKLRAGWEATTSLLRARGSEAGASSGVLLLVPSSSSSQSTVGKAGRCRVQRRLGRKKRTNIVYFRYINIYNIRYRWTFIFLTVPVPSPRSSGCCCPLLSLDGGAGTGPGADGGVKPDGARAWGRLEPSECNYAANFLNRSS